jgi:hypothetical protein
VSRSNDAIRREQRRWVDKQIAEVQAILEAEHAGRSRIDGAPRPDRKKGTTLAKRVRTRSQRSVSCRRCSTPITERRCPGCGHIVRKRRRIQH